MPGSPSSQSHSHHAPKRFVTLRSWDYRPGRKIGDGAEGGKAMTGDRAGRTQGKGFSYVMAVAIAALLILAAKTASDYRNDWVKGAQPDARTEAYFAEHSGPFCAFEGVWYDWEDDETITLGCLEVKGNIRQGSYSSAMGPRATSDFSMSGTYDIDSDSSMHVIGKDREGKDVKFTTMIYVEDKEYPTQMIVIDEKGEGGFYIWQRKE
jgi:hypothetical protein